MLIGDTFLLTEVPGSANVFPLVSEDFFATISAMELKQEVNFIINPLGLPKFCDNNFKHNLENCFGVGASIANSLLGLHSFLWLGFPALSNLQRH